MAEGAIETNQTGAHMIRFFLTFITIQSLVLTAQAASQLKVPRLKTVGAMKNKVIAQTAPEFISKSGRTSKLRRFYVARWGVHRYEYGYVNISCTNQKCELVDKEVRLQFFESCHGLKRNGEPNCTKPLSDSSDFSENNNSEDRPSRPWYACEDYGVNCGRNQDERSYDDFPGRSDSRYDGGSVDSFREERY